MNVLKTKYLHEEYQNYNMVFLFFYANFQKGGLTLWQYSE